LNQHVHDLETVDRCLLCASQNVGVADRDFHFCRCAECGYVYDSPRPTRASIVRFYSAQDRYEDWLQHDHDRDRLWRRRLNKLLPSARPGNLLDVGTGIGQFLAIAKPHFSEVMGTEVSATAVEIARSRYGLDVLRGAIEEIELPAASFDNISMVHVLEHVHEPLATLQRCHELLRTGGVLLVCVPNDVRSWSTRVQAMAARISKNGRRSAVLGLPRATEAREIHLSHFTTATLRFALERTGFVVRQMGCDPFYVASGLKLLLHEANYRIHDAFRLPSYQTIWCVAEKRSA
jgi:SAM-dependent methyltransferase